MSELKRVIDEIGISALESNVKIAALAVVSNSGQLIYQTENFDLKNKVNTIMTAMKGGDSIKITDQEFILEGNPSEGLIGRNPSGMGYVILIPFQGGILVSYALPQADPNKVLKFLKDSSLRLDIKS